MAENVYLKNRPGTDSLIASFRGAIAAEFTHNVPTEYVDAMVVDDKDAGTIKAYKVSVTGGYKVVIASTQNICTNEMSFASFFKMFDKLESVQFDNINTSKSTSFVGMFSGCKALKSVDMKKFNTANVTEFGWMFDKGCDSLVRIEIGPEFIINNNASLHFMFENCSSLTDIVVPAGAD